MGKYYFLRDEEGRYYESELVVTWNENNALKFKSLNEIITTIPIMKDWNWDFGVFEVSNGKVERINDNICWDMYHKWKKSNPEDHKKLYNE